MKILRISSEWKYSGFLPIENIKDFFPLKILRISSHPLTSQRRSIKRTFGPFYVPPLGVGGKRQTGWLGAGARAVCFPVSSFKWFTKYCFSFSFFFRRDALKEQFGKEPSTVRCLAVKSALLGTRHPRKEKEAALQNVTGEPACQYGKILRTTQAEMEPSIKLKKWSP